MKLMRFRALLLVLGTLLLPALAFADIPLTFGARIGYSFPAGSAEKSVSLSDTTSGALPIQLDAFYRITPKIHAGAYFSFGPAFNGAMASLAADGKASQSQIRYGIQGQYHFASAPEVMDPWGGITLGFESARLSTTPDSGGDKYSGSTSAFMFGVEGGVGWTVMNNLRVGPFLGIALGSYGSVSTTVTKHGVTTDGSIDIPETAIHTWITLGVSGTFSLGSAPVVAAEPEAN